MSPVPCRAVWRSKNACLRQARAYMRLRCQPLLRNRCRRHCRCSARCCLRCGMPGYVAVRARCELLAWCDGAQQPLTSSTSACAFTARRRQYLVTFEVRCARWPGGAMPASLRLARQRLQQPKGERREVANAWLFIQFCHLAAPA